MGLTVPEEQHPLHGQKQEIELLLSRQKIFNLSCFFSLGVNIARRIDKLGMRSSDTAEVFFDDVRVPRKNVIGQEGLGFTYQMLQFQEERLWAAANSEAAI